MESAEAVQAQRIDKARVRLHNWGNCMANVICSQVGLVGCLWGYRIFNKGKALLRIINCGLYAQRQDKDGAGMTKIHAGDGSGLSPSGQVR